MRKDVKRTHGENVIAKDSKFEIIDADENYLSFQIDDIYNKESDEEIPGLLIEAAAPGEPMCSVVVSLETIESLVAWFNKRLEEN